MEIRGFSLCNGGLLYRLMLLVGTDESGRPRRGRVILISILVTWIPMLVLSLVQRLALGKAGTVGFLQDYASYARFLVAVPLLILAEPIADRHFGGVVWSLSASKLVNDSDRPTIAAAVERVYALRDSVTASIILILLAYVISYFEGYLRSFSLGLLTWRTLGSGRTMSIAGWWYVVIGAPIIEYLLLLWLWRLIIWFRFLLDTSKMNLQTTPTHPDQAGGLGFLGVGQLGFIVPVIAASCLLAAGLARGIVYRHMSISSVEVPMVATLIIALILFLGPLLIFTPRLIKTKRKGLFEYGNLGSRYTLRFDRKWVRERSDDDAVLGTSDIQSLADLANSFHVIRRMRVFPFDAVTVIQFAAAVVIPILPVYLAAVPVEVILKSIARLLARSLGGG